MKTYYYHGKTTDNRRFTVAGTYEKDDILILGISLCSNNDPFVKKVGRNKAEGRIKATITRGRTFIYLPSKPQKPIETFCKECTNFDKYNTRQVQHIFNL